MSKELIMTDKLLDILALGVRDYCRVLAFEGTARSSKTAIAIQTTYYGIFDSPEKRHLIGARDLDAIRNNILKADTVGLLETHPDVEMIRDSIGGNFLRLKTPKGIKEIILVSYSDKSSWKKILGGSFGIVYLDEVNIADPNFVRETFARQLNADNPLTIMTTNGDNPDHFIYQEYYNYCKVLFGAPSSTLAFIDEFQAKNGGARNGWYYCHFKMSDNPSMTPEKIASSNIYTIGSYYYTTKILGERGISGDTIFGEYMTQDLLVDAYDTKKFSYKRYTIAADIGSTRASNVFGITGWEANYSKAVRLKMESFNQSGYKSKTKKLKEFLREIIYNPDMIGKIQQLKILPGQIDGLFIDSAESNYINDIRDEIYREFGIKVYGSDKKTIHDRIEMMIIGFASKRILFDYSCELGYRSYASAMWAEGKKGKEREDKNEEKNDVMDEFEYSLTPHMKKLMRNGGVD